MSGVSPSAAYISDPVGRSEPLQSHLILRSALRSIGLSASYASSMQYLFYVLSMYAAWERAEPFFTWVAISSKALWASCHFASYFSCFPLGLRQSSTSDCPTYGNYDSCRSQHDFWTRRLHVATARAQRPHPAKYLRIKGSCKKSWQSS